jgi:hypothetical protein
MKPRSGPRIAAGLAIATALAAGVASAQTPPVRARVDFAPVGVVGSQTLQVTVASLRPAPEGIPPPVGDRVRIFLLDASGERVADSGIRVLPAVQMEALTVRREQLPASESGRVQVRAVVLTWNVNGLPPSPIRSSAEILNAQGRTLVYLPPPVPDQPPPVPD